MVGLAQQPRSFLAIAEAVLDPAEAVGDEGLAGLERERLADQVARLLQAQVALGQRIAERVVGVVLFGLDL
jgi:hypothetical protein